MSGEVPASVYADKHGMSVGLVRTASFEPRAIDERMLSAKLSYEDGMHLLDRLIDVAGGW